MLRQIQSDTITNYRHHIKITCIKKLSEEGDEQKRKKQVNCSKRKSFTKMRLHLVQLRSNNCLSVFWSWNQQLSLTLWQSICSIGSVSTLNWNVVNYDLIQFGSTFLVILHSVAVRQLLARAAQFDIDSRFSSVCAVCIFFFVLVEHRNLTFLSE